MSFNSKLHHRELLRLQNYDYSQAGAYFITICTQNRASLFGDVVDGVMVLNGAGRIMQKVWDELPLHYAKVELDAFVVMPNHVHGIIILQGQGLLNQKGVINHAPTGGAEKIPVQHDVGAQFIAPRGNEAAPKKLGEVVRGFKARCTYTINQASDMQDVSLWQRNYYEHVIRGDNDLANIREYIVNNPMQWHLDRENPGFIDAQVNQGVINHAPTGGAEKIPVQYDVGAQFIAPKDVTHNDIGRKVGRND